MTEKIGSFKNSRSYPKKTLDDIHDLVTATLKAVTANKNIQKIVSKSTSIFITSISEENSALDSTCKSHGTCVEVSYPLSILSTE
jgi:spore coat polysaccharide biosynthesis protein SpsF (cytidylyltransferase family)